MAVRGKRYERSKLMDYLWAFLIGGLFCAIGQVLMDFTKLTPARILVAYVTGGVLLGALGLYKPLIDSQAVAQLSLSRASAIFSITVSVNK